MVAEFEHFMLKKKQTHKKPLGEASSVISTVPHFIPGISWLFDGYFYKKLWNLQDDNTPAILRWKIETKMQKELFFVCVICIIFYWMPTEMFPLSIHFK